MSGSSNPRKDLTELESQIKKLRRQFGEQLVFLDSRTTTKQELISDLNEFFRIRAEIEATYAASLERLAERMSSKRSLTQRKEPTTTVELLNSLLNETRALGRERHAFSEKMSGEIGLRLDALNKDAQLIHKRVKEIMQTCHDDLSRSYKDLVEDLKFYQATCQQTADAEDKLQKTTQKGKLLVPKDPNQLRASVKKKVKEQSDREEKATDLVRKMRSKRMVARNKYISALGTANSSTKRHFNVELMDILEALDYDFHHGLERLGRSFVDSEQTAIDSERDVIDRMIACAESLSFDSDKYKLVEESSSAFIPPSSFRHCAYPSDKVSWFVPQEQTEDDLVELQNEIDRLKTQLEEEQKTLEFVSHTLDQQKLGEDVVLFDESPSTPKGSISSASDKKSSTLERKQGNFSSLDKKQSGSRQMHPRTSSMSGIGALSKDSLNFYFDILQRLRAVKTNLSFSESKADIYCKALNDQKTRKMKLDGLPQAKLFEGDLAEYLQIMEVSLPVIVRSCCKHLEEFGLGMEGLFRVPGPQALIDELKEGFERGEDPLTGNPQSRDINAVASVLKEYFRRLKCPLFPESMYKNLITCGRISNLEIRVVAVSREVESVPKLVKQVMAFLFQFLKMVSEHSAATKMTSSNLAVVFGPTLTRSPPGSEEFALSSSPCINTVMQTCIDHFDQIFEAVEEPRDEDDGGNENEVNVRESLSDEDYPSEADSEGFYSDEAIEAIAIHDYEARSNEEVSFHKGQSVYVLQQTDDGNWWDGFVGSKRGYIPTQYVEIVPFDGPKSPRNSLTGTEESGLDDPDVKQAVKRPTECNLKFLDPPVTVMVSGTGSSPNTPDTVVTNEEALGNSNLPPPPFSAVSSTSPVDESSINDAMETLTTAICDLENLVSNDEQQQVGDDTGNEQEEEEGEKEEDEWKIELSPEATTEAEEEEAFQQQSVEREIASPPSEEQEEQSPQQEKAPQIEQQQQEQPPSGPYKHSLSPIPKLPPRPPHIGSKPFRSVGRSGQPNIVHPQPIPGKLAQPPMVGHSQSADNIFVQIKGARGANRKDTDQRDTKKDMTSPTGPQPPFPTTQVPSNPAVKKIVPKKSKSAASPTGAGMHPKPPPPIIPKKPGIGGLASQIKAKADAFRSRATYGKKDDDTVSSGGNSSGRGDFVDEPGITHL